MPVRFGLELAVRSRRARIAIIDKRHTVPNENAFFDCDAFADKAVAGNFATRPDFCTFLDFNEGANFRFVTDLASVKVHKPTDLNIASELYIGRYKLVGDPVLSHALKQSRTKGPKAGSITGASRPLDAPLIYWVLLLFFFFPFCSSGLVCASIMVRTSKSKRQRVPTAYLSVPATLQRYRTSIVKIQNQAGDWPRAPIYDSISSDFGT